tara:strand:+ start:25738 stop:27162 length:1425 start_codon:yes stop_codon:yes gene_type:complete
MDEHTSERGLCPECGLGPADIKSDADGAKAYRLRIRRRAFGVWLFVFLLLGVLGLPWVQVWVGEWGFADRIGLGNSMAIDGWYEEDLYNDVAYKALIDPPIRYVDLERVARGEGDAVEQFRLSVGHALGKQSMLEEAYSSYSFSVGQSGQINPLRDGGFIKVGEPDGVDEAVDYGFLSMDFQRMGWPSTWVSTNTIRWYGFDPQLVSVDRLLDIDHDMVHAYKAEQAVLWDNILFAATLAVFIGWLSARLCLWRRVDRKRSFVARVVIAGVCVSLVLFVGLQERQLPSRPLSGRLLPSSTLPQYVIDHQKLQGILGADEQVQALGTSVLDDLALTKTPNALITMGVRCPVHMTSDVYSYGVGRVRLLSFEAYEMTRLETDGTFTKLPLLEEDRVWNTWSGNGMFSARLGLGTPEMKNVGLLIEYQNIFMVGLGLYVFWRLMAWVAGAWFLRQQRRRARRGLCVWCRYPVAGAGD